MSSLLLACATIACDCPWRSLADRATDVPRHHAVCAPAQAIRSPPLAAIEQVLHGKRMRLMETTMLYNASEGYRKGGARWWRVGRGRAGRGDFRLSSAQLPNVLLRAQRYTQQGAGERLSPARFAPKEASGFRASTSLSGDSRAVLVLNRGKPGHRKRLASVLLEARSWAARF